MECVPSQKRIVLLFLQPIWRARTLLVPRGHVPRRRFTERLRFSAFENDDFLRHRNYSFTSAGAAGSSSSPSPPSSSVRPKRDVTDWRTREALLCFSSCDWHSTVKRANGIASRRARGIGLPDISHFPYVPSSIRLSASSISYSASCSCESKLSAKSRSYASDPASAWCIPNADASLPSARERSAPWATPAIESTTASRS